MTPTAPLRVRTRSAQVGGALPILLRRWGYLDLFCRRRPLPCFFFLDSAAIRPFSLAYPYLEISLFFSSSWECKRRAYKGKKGPPSPITRAPPYAWIDSFFSAIFDSRFLKSGWARRTARGLFFPFPPPMDYVPGEDFLGWEPLSQFQRVGKRFFSLLAAIDSPFSYITAGFSSLSFPRFFYKHLSARPFFFFFPGLCTRTNGTLFSFVIEKWLPPPLFPP